MRWRPVHVIRYGESGWILVTAKSRLERRKFPGLRIDGSKTWLKSISE